MRTISASIGGLLGGLIGCMIWVGISYATHFEIGWIAWAVGFLVGLGVRLGAQEWDGYLPGALAVVLALLSIVAGKFVAAEITVPIQVNLDPTAQDVKNTIARNILIEYGAKGIRLEWPKGNTQKQVQTQLDNQIYPEVVKLEADRRWNDLSETQQKEMIQKEKERLDESMRKFKEETRQQFFQNNFRIVDCIFFILAAITAFRIGSGMLTPQRRRY